MSIRVSNLSFSYGKREVLSGVSFEIPDGCLCAVLGSNGAGKTTLFKCILGILKKYDGDIFADGVLTKELSDRELAHKIAYIPQTGKNTFEFTVRDMVLMGTDHNLGMFTSPGKNEMAKAEESLEKVGLIEKMYKYYSRLSGGEQQLVLIARALAQGSKTLLMDEPTSALDYGNQNLIMEQAKKLAADGYCVVMSTHTPQHALWYADKVIAINNSKIEADGAAEILNEELLKILYGVETDFINTENGKIICPIRKEKDK